MQESKTFLVYKVRYGNGYSQYWFTENEPRKDLLPIKAYSAEGLGKTLKEIADAVRVKLEGEKEYFYLSFEPPFSMIVAKDNLQLAYPLTRAERTKLFNLLSRMCKC